MKTKSRTYFGSILLFVLVGLQYLVMTKAWGLDVKSWPWFIGTTLAIWIIGGIASVVSED